jgi:hypothetical protein
MTTMPQQREHLTFPSKADAQRWCDAHGTLAWPHEVRLGTWILVFVAPCGKAAAIGPCGTVGSILEGW